jgi:hypothetical protein
MGMTEKTNFLQGKGEHKKWKQKKSFLVFWVFFLILQRVCVWKRMKKFWSLSEGVVCCKVEERKKKETAAQIVREPIWKLCVSKSKKFVLFCLWKKRVSSQTHTQSFHSNTHAKIESVSFFLCVLFSLSNTALQTKAFFFLTKKKAQASKKLVRLSFTHTQTPSASKKISTQKIWFQKLFELPLCFQAKQA